MPECIIIKTDESNPEPIVQRYCQLLLEGAEAATQLLCISYPFEAYWLAEPANNELTALYCLQLGESGVEISFTVTEQSPSLRQKSAEVGSMATSSLAAFNTLCEHLQLPSFSSVQPLMLSSIDIPKPWGKEVWYTGIEARGVAEVSDGSYKLPLPWVLSALPTSLCADLQRTLILLKTLDPLPEEVFGDLYFELHEEKREIYVVTAVDHNAWPGGVGGIRFGFDQQQRESFGSDQAFRSAFVKAVKSYEKVRRKIDDIVDGLRERDAVDLDEAVDATVLSNWLQEIPADLKTREIKLRAQMDSFTNRLPLSLGDVIKVPCLTPHSLQHGVRTVEFQTPVYERLILSFAQKVLTQQHWNTEAAAEIMNLDAPEQPVHELLVDSDGIMVERIVDFEDFEVQRVTVAPDNDFDLAKPALYGLLMVIKGKIKLGGSQIAEEQAVILPSSWKGCKVANQTSGDLCFLLAYPKTFTK